MAEFIFFILVVAMFSIVLLIKAVTIVTQGNEYTVERFGEYKGTLAPSLRRVNNKHVTICATDAICMPNFL